MGHRPRFQQNSHQYCPPPSDVVILPSSTARYSSNVEPTSAVVVLPPANPSPAGLSRDVIEQLTGCSIDILARARGWRHEDGREPAANASSQQVAAAGRFVSIGSESVESILTRHGFRAPGSQPQVRPDQGSPQAPPTNPAAGTDVLSRIGAMLPDSLRSQLGSGLQTLVAGQVLSQLTPADIRNIETAHELLAPDRFGGADGRFDGQDFCAVRDSLLRSPEVASQISSGIWAQAQQRIDYRASGRPRWAIGRAIAGRVVSNNVERNWGTYYSQGMSIACGRIEGQLSQGLQEMGAPLTSGTPQDGTPRCVTPSDTERFTHALRGLRDLQARLSAAHPGLFPPGNNVSRAQLGQLLTLINAGREQPGS